MRGASVGVFRQTPGNSAQPPQMEAEGISKTQRMEGAMDQHEKSIRVGATVIACALALRLGVTGFFQPVVNFLTQPNIASFFLYLETGRKVRFSPSLEETIQHSAESPPPAVFSTVPTEPAAAVFSADQAETIEFFYSITVFKHTSKVCCTLSVPF